jgi:hypothetical protein
MREKWFGFSLRNTAPQVVESVIGQLFPDLQARIGEQLIAAFYSRLYDGVPILNVYLKARGPNEEAVDALRDLLFEIVRIHATAWNLPVEEAEYFAQTRRYGGDRMMQHVETFFTSSSRIAAALFAVGASTVADKVGLGFALNAAILDRLPLQPAQREAFLHGVGRTWEQYYKEQNYPLGRIREALLEQLRECLRNCRPEVRMGDLFLDYADSVDNIWMAACGLDRHELLETPAHAAELRSLWNQIPSDCAAFAQISIGLMHMNWNKFGIFGELEVAMYRLLQEEFSRK